MAVYELRMRSFNGLAGYFWFNSRVATPAWLDDNFGDLFVRHPRLAKLNFWVWARLRSMRVIQRREVAAGEWSGRVIADRPPRVRRTNGEWVTL